MMDCVYLIYRGMFGRNHDVEYRFELDADGEPCSAELYIDEVLIDGDVGSDEYMKAWKYGIEEQRRADAEDLAEMQRRAA